ncbi:hypothetical protein Patl1_34061 [Pistacia atlantica]|uniref:Uncharacterized protein n=1 Tax=Pistacia atlantica TaxID=434234 RepID=A0ACC0ZV59_9ROSI|nr:hypothetical protein Patl1_34061 [Pistacia atlantica]
MSYSKKNDTIMNLDLTGPKSLTSLTSKLILYVNICSNNHQPQGQIHFRCGTDLLVQVP